MQFSKILFFLLTLFSTSVFLHAQEKSPFEKRLDEIKKQLEYLGDTIAPGLKEPVDLSVSAMPLQTFLRTIAESHNLNIQIDPSLTISLTNNFN